MREPKSFADFLTDWERLILAVDNNGSQLPNVDPQLVPLQQILEEAKVLGARQDAARAQFAADAKRRRQIQFEGRAAATRLRAAIKAHYGGHNEKLSEFGMRALRQRRASTPDPEPPPPPQPPVE